MINREKSVDLEFKSIKNFIGYKLQYTYKSPSAGYFKNPEKKSGFLGDKFL